MFSSWEEICSSKELGRKSLDEKILRFCHYFFSTHENLHNGLGLDENVYNMQGQAAYVQ